jgi:hypothetical protein
VAVHKRDERRQNSAYAASEWFGLAVFAWLVMPGLLLLSRRYGGQLLTGWCVVTGLLLLSAMGRVV